MAKLSLAKSAQNLNLSNQKTNLLQKLFLFGNKIDDVFYRPQSFVLPNARQLVKDWNAMVDFVFT